MAASLDQSAVNALNDALRKRSARAVAESEADDAYVRYLRDARAAGWTWKRIGGELGITSRAAEKHWKRNRMRAGRLGDAPSK